MAGSSASHCPSRNVQGRVVGTSAIARDVTGRKQAELDLAERTMQLALAESAGYLCQSSFGANSHRMPGAGIRRPAAPKSSCAGGGSSNRNGAALVGDPSRKIQRAPEKKWARGEVGFRSLPHAARDIQEAHRECFADCRPPHQGKPTPVI